MRAQGTEEAHSPLTVLTDLSQLDRERQMLLTAHFLASLVECPRELWHPALVAIDEAHLLAPYGVQGYEAASVRKASVAAIADLMARGRKRGLVGIIATQRLARLSKSVVSEATNFLIGVNTLDLDIRRAAETIGWDARRAFDRLPVLSPGDFVAVGPAFANAPLVATIGSVRSRHMGAAPAIAAPRNQGAAAGSQLLGLATLAESAQRGKDGDDQGLQTGARAVRKFILDPAFPLAGRVFSELAPLYPDGSMLADLAAAIAVPIEDAAGAIALLEGFNAVEIRGEQPALSVRIHPSLGRAR